MRYARHAWAGIAGVMLGASSATAQDAAAPLADLLPVRVDAAYAGKYADQEWMTAILRSLPARMSSAYRRACTALGVDVASLDWTQFRLDVRDAQGAGRPTWSRYNGASLMTGGYLPPKGPYLIIRIHAEFLRNGYVHDLDQELLHEAIHAVQRATVPKFKDGPKWLKEGIALLLAGQGEYRARQILAFGSMALAPEKMLNGLEEPGARHNLNDYGEDYLAFEYLGQCAELAPAEAGKRLHQRWQGGADWKAALEAVAGKSWDEFRTGALVHARERLREFQDDAQRAYRAFVAARAPAQRLALTVKFLEAHPDSHLAELAHYYAGAAHRDAKRPGEAIAAFRRMLPGTLHTGMEDDARFWIAHLELQRGNHEVALEQFRRLVTDHPKSSWIANAAFGWGLALDKLGRADEARKICAKAVRSFPKHRDRRAFETARRIATGQ